MNFSGSLLMAIPKDERRDYTAEKFDPFARSLGRVTLAWNSLHTELFGIFWAASGYANGLIPGAIWNALKVDRAQRDILKDLTTSKAHGISLSKKVRGKINWILDNANELENIRNDLIHTTFAIDRGAPFALHLGQHKRGLSFEGRNPQAEADWIFERTMLLSIYAQELSEVIRRRDETLPKQPSLPTRPGSSAK